MGDESRSWYPHPPALSSLANDGTSVLFIRDVLYYAGAPQETNGNVNSLESALIYKSEVMGILLSSTFLSLATNSCLQTTLNKLNLYTLTHN